MQRASLRVLGAVRVDGVRIASPAGASMLAYLAIHGPRVVPREHMSFALWPDRSEDRARRTLSDTVYRLRGAFPDGAPWLVTGPDELQLVDVDVDLWQFRHLAVTDDAALLVEALDLRRGPLADGVDDEWVDLPRRAHDETVIRICERACASLPPAQRLPVAERWVEIDPYGVQPHHCVIETLLALDRRDGARRAIDRYRSVLDALGLVDTETDRWVALAADSSTVEVPFVGRSAERGRLLRALDAACEGRGGLAVVLGDAGIGKSRLLAELADAARWRGVDVAAGGSDEYEPARPLAPLDTALSDAFDEVRVEQARCQLGADLLRSLSAVVHRLGEPGPSDTSPDRAIAQALEWLATVRPQLLLLDDAHCGGAELWPTLVRLAPRLACLPVMVVVAARRAEVLDKGARRSIGKLEAEGAPIVHLSGLSVGELDQLVRGLGRDDDARSLHDRSGGNPLVALAWVDSPGDNDDGPGDAHRVAVAAQRRLAQLDDDGRLVVRQAAVLGRAVEYRVLAAACADHTGDVFRHVVAAETAGLLTRVAGRLAFAHDLVRAAVLDDVAAGERSALHRRALAAVAHEVPDATGRLLGHAEAAGDDVAVVAYSIAAGTDALHQSAYRVADGHFSRALELGRAVDDPLARHAALGGRVRARDRLAERTGQGADVAELVADAEGVGGPLLLESLVLDAEYRFAVGDYEGALTAVERAAGREVAALVGEPAVSTDLARIASVTLRELGRYDEAGKIGQAVLTRFETNGDEFGAALMTDVLGGIAWRRGDPPAAAILHQRAADRFAAIGARGAEARALNNLGTALWAIGDDHAAEVVHRRALDVCRELEDRRGEGDNLDNLGGVSFVRGDFRTAIELYGVALAIRRDTDDPWGVSISLSNMGDAHRALGEHEQALELIEESIAVNRAAGVVRNDATTLQSRGLVLADLARFDEALADLSAAEQMHVALGDRANLLETRSGVLDVLVATCSKPAVIASCAGLAVDLATQVTAEDPPRTRQLAHVSLAAAHAVLGDSATARHHAALAVEAMEEALAGLDAGDAALRRSTVPIHRRTVALGEREGRVITVDVARVDAPVGAALGAEHLAAVRWTVERPDDELIADLPTRRRAVLVRLLAEAAAAGAAPTDEQLAAACGVTRRTVLRDVEILRAHGQPVTTRGRLRTVAQVPAPDR